MVYSLKIIAKQVPPLTIVLKIEIKSTNSAPWIDAEVLKAVEKKDRKKERLESRLKSDSLNITGQYLYCIVQDLKSLIKWKHN